MPKLNIYLIAFLFCFVNVLKSQKVYTLSSTKEPQSVNRAFTYFIDETNQLTIDNILQKGNFKPTKEEVPNLNVTKGTSWSAIKLICKEEADWYLSLEPSGVNMASVFQQTNGGSWIEESQGLLVSQKSRRIPTNNFLFKIHVHPKDTTTVLLKIKDYLPITLILKTGTLESFIATFHYSNFFIV